VETVNNTINHMMYMNNLTTNEAYEVKVRGATRSLVGEKKLHLGEWSETKAVFLQPGCEDMKHFQPSKSEDRRGHEALPTVQVRGPNHLAKP